MNRLEIYLCAWLAIIVSGCGGSGVKSAFPSDGEKPSIEEPRGGCRLMNETEIPDWVSEHSEATDFAACRDCHLECLPAIEAALKKRGLIASPSVFFKIIDEFEKAFEPEI